MSDPLAPLVRRQRRDINTLFGTLADAMENAFARHTTPGQPVTNTDRVRIMADVDRALDVIYGNRPNDPEAALWTVVVRDTRAARFRPLDAAVKRWKGAMTSALRARVEREAQRG
jgi:hypothetical protein